MVINIYELPLVVKSCYIHDMANASTLIAKGLPAQNPVMLAAGTCENGVDLHKHIPVNNLGGIVTKTITYDPSDGNAGPQIAELPYGILNSVGLQNIGVDAFCKDKLPLLNDLEIPVLVSITGKSTTDLFRITERICQESMKEEIGFEVNLSCPNIRYEEGRTFSHVKDLVYSAVRHVKYATDRPVAAKLSPDVPDIAPYAKAAELAEADAITVANTVPGMKINVLTRRPVLGNVTGGLSGPAIFPIALRHVFKAAQAVSIPIIGVGGISTANDALQMLIAGASAVQIGTARFHDTMAANNVVADIYKYLECKKQTLQEVIGSMVT